MDHSEKIDEESNDIRGTDYSHGTEIIVTSSTMGNVNISDVEKKLILKHSENIVKI